jgi:hypothetical protein
MKVRLGEARRLLDRITLSDLGLSPSQTKPDPDLQARLDRHTRMLRIHQRLGLITLAPLAGACITSAFAPPDLKKGRDNTTGRDIHVGLSAASCRGADLDQILMQLDAAAGGSFRNFRHADGVRGGEAYMVTRPAWIAISKSSSPATPRTTLT